MGKPHADPGFSEAVSDYHTLASRVPASLRHRLPHRLRRALSRSYWLFCDLRDFLAEVVGLVPSHSFRLLCYRYGFGVHVGAHTSIHRGCRLYRPPGVGIGRNTVINRDVLLDGRMGIEIGNNASISEGTVILTLGHDPQSPAFTERGAPVHIGDHVFVGARAIILPGATLGEGCVVGAGTVVSGDVAPFTIVAGAPARLIGRRPQDLGYVLKYRKFLG